jgi:hypothetical protein
MLYEFLKNNYKEAEPIFFSDIVIEGITKSAVNQQLKKLCDEGKLQKYENGIYYLPKKSRLKTNVGVNASTILYCSGLPDIIHSVTFVCFKHITSIPKNV